MSFESYDSMIDSVMFSKDPRDESQEQCDAENSSAYYYDDSTGYRIYKPENEEEDVKDEEEEDE